MSAKIGLNCKMYRNTATWGAPTWVEVPLVGPLQVGANWAEATGQTRETWVERAARTFLQLNPTGQFRVVDADTTYIAFDDAFHDPDTVLDLMILNGASTENGVTGYRAEWEVMQWAEDQGPGNVLFKDFGLKPGFPSDTTHKPQRVEVSAGAPVFTDLDS